MAIAHVQTAADVRQDGDGLTIVIPFAANVTAENLLVVVATWGDASNTPTISDTLGTIYTRVGPMFGTGDNQSGALWYGFAPSSGANTVTVDIGPGGQSALYRDIGASEFSGADTTGVVTASVANQGPSTTQATGSVATTAANSLVFTFLNDTDASGSVTVPSGFTLRSGSSAFTIYSASQIKATAGTINPAWSNGSSNNWNGATVAFKPAGAGGTDVSLTGAVSGLTQAAPTGSISLASNVSLTGEVVGVVIAAPAGSVSLTSGTDVNLTGEVSALTIGVADGSVSVSSNITATGEVVGITVAAPAGTSSTTSNVSDTGQVVGLTIGAPSGSVSVTTNVSLVGEPSGLSIAAPAGTLTLSTIGDVSFTGQPSGIAVATPTGSLSIVSNVSLTGQVVGVSTASLGGSLDTTSNVALAGQLVGITIDAPAGSISGMSIDIHLTGDPVGVSIDAPVGSIVVGNTLYFFTPPTREIHYGDVKRSPLMVRIGFQTGLTVIKRGGFYSQSHDPDDEDIEAADVTYLGGHVYEISQDEYNDLLTAGYEANLSTELVSA